MDISKLQVSQTALGKLSGTQNRTLGHECGKAQVGEGGGGGGGVIRKQYMYEIVRGQI